MRSESEGPESRPLHMRFLCSRLLIGAAAENGRAAGRNMPCTGVRYTGTLSKNSAGTHGINPAQQPIGFIVLFFAHSVKPIPRGRADFVQKTVRHRRKKQGERRGLLDKAAGSEYNWKRYKRRQTAMTFLRREQDEEEDAGPAAGADAAAGVRPG